MYQTHWGLQESPFRGGFDPQTFFQSQTHEEALARLNFLVDDRRRLGLLLGPGGSGKSLLLELFAQQLRRHGRSTAKMSLLDVCAPEMLCLLSAQWGLPPKSPRATAALWRGLTDRLLENRCLDQQTVILLDDVERADPKALEHVARLVSFSQNSGSLLTVVLAGREEMLAKISGAMLDRVELRIDIEPWAPDDTREFINTLLARAGQKTPIFDAPAVDRLQELSHGIPRSVTHLADMALLVGASQNLNQIDAGVIDEVYQELGVSG
jgi:type II secretory pathway predicted ATPase ExeA